MNFSCQSLLQSENNVSGNIWLKIEQLHLFLSCPCPGGPLELHTLSLLPSQHQVVFKGDRLPFHCTAALVDNMTTIHWHHNGKLVTSDSEIGVQLESSVMHDCTFITRY